MWMKYVFLVLQHDIDKVPALKNMYAYDSAIATYELVFLMPYIEYTVEVVHTIPEGCHTHGAYTLYEDHPVRIEIDTFSQNSEFVTTHHQVIPHIIFVVHMYLSWNILCCRALVGSILGWTCMRVHRIYPHSLVVERFHVRLSCSMDFAAYWHRYGFITPCGYTTHLSVASMQFTRYVYTACIHSHILTNMEDSMLNP